MGFKAIARVPELVIRPGLTLRRWTLSDATVLFALVEKNRSYLRQWMSWLDAHTHESHTRAFLQDCLDGYKSGKSHRWAIIADGEIVGSLGLEDIQPLHRRAEIGYWISQEHQGSGCITAAVRGVIDYAFSEEKLNLLEIRAATENQKSRAVAGRVGMTHEGVLREREWLYDHHVDHAIYTLLSSEWILACTT
ncbi:MAG: GNAT family N-acetyltransferase [Kofleriaceae bacterium]|nr:GNAT family N-acetyltransferase [Kofleriaceae bacterium]